MRWFPSKRKNVRNRIGSGRSVVRFRWRLSLLLAAQLDDDVGVDTGCLHESRHSGSFVGAVEVGVELRVSCAEGHAARNVVDIGAAADGNALARLPVSS